MPLNTRRKQFCYFFLLSYLLPSSQRTEPELRSKLERKNISNPHTLCALVSHFSEFSLASFRSEWESLHKKAMFEGLVCVCVWMVCIEGRRKEKCRRVHITVQDSEREREKVQGRRAKTYSAPTNGQSVLDVFYFSFSLFTHSLTLTSDDDRFLKCGNRSFASITQNQCSFLLISLFLSVTLIKCFSII